MSFDEQFYNTISNNVSVIYENVEITDTTDLVRDLGFDSITIIQLILDIEENFGVQFDDEIEYKDITVVGNLKQYIQKKQFRSENNDV